MKFEYVEIRGRWFPIVPLLVGVGEGLFEAFSVLFSDREKTITLERL